MRALAWMMLVFSAAVSAAPAPRIAVSTLFANPTFSRPVLSDDGKTFAYIISKGDLQVVVSRPVAGGELTPLVKIEDPEYRLSWLDWANSKRLFISAQSRNLMTIGMKGRLTRLFAVDRDGKNYTWLGKNWPLFGQLQLPVTYQDQIVHWTPDDPDHVLIQYWPPYDVSPKVMRMDVNRGGLQLVQGSLEQIRDWHADTKGQLRAGETNDDNIYELWARVSEKDDFSKVLAHKLFEEDGPTFAGFHADPKKLYVYALHEGRNAIYEFDMTTGTLGALVYAHPEVDVDRIQRDPGGDRRVVGVRYTVDRPEIQFFDPVAANEHEALRRALAKEFPVPVLAEPVSVSADGIQQILEVSSEVQPPVYYFYDRGKHQLTRILDERPDIVAANMAPTKRVTYTARDGLEIPAYLTLPIGVEPKALPAVALVHGGPWSRDDIGWDPEVQLLANRGFAVLQMNFRGSTGYGKKFLEAGYREWGQKIQDDITDGVRWLIAAGVADPDRIGIAGGSYGGYATLVGLVKTPELYRAGAAYAPVTDIEFLLSDDKWINWGYQWAATMVGGGSGDKARLRESSPLRRAAEVRVPVLIGHGTDDQRVHVRQSRRMADALRAAGKNVEYMEFPDEIHGFLLDANRVRWYERFAAFFEENLKPRPAAASTGGAD